MMNSNNYFAGYTAREQPRDIKVGQSTKGHSTATSVYSSSSSSTSTAASSTSGYSTYKPSSSAHLLSQQAQTSGHLHATQTHLSTLQNKTTSRLANSRTRYTQGLRDAQELKQDLAWTQSQVDKLTRRAESRYPGHFQKAREEVRGEVDEDDEY